MELVGNGSRSRRARSFKRLAAAGAATLALAAASGCDGSSAADNSDSTGVRDSGDPTGSVTASGSDITATTESDATDPSESDTSESDTTDTSEDGGDDDTATDTTLGLSLLTESQRKLIEGIATTDVARSLDYTVRQSTVDGVQSEILSTLREVDADGDTHNIVRPGTILAGPEALAGPGGDTDQQVESWSDGAWLYLEYTGFSDADPVLDMFNLFPAPDEWLEPGVFKVDVGRVGDELGLTPAEVDEALSGPTLQGIGQVDLFLYYVAIHADGADPDPNDPSIQRIETTYGEIGDDINALVGGTAPSSTPAPDREQFEEAVSQIPVNFTFSIDDQGRIDQLVVEENHAGLVSPEQTASPETAPSVSSAASSQIYTYSVDNGFDDDIEMPSDVTDDRTDAFIEWYSSVNSSMSTPTEDTIAPTSSTTG